jgi:hypothetical protein
MMRPTFLIEFHDGRWRINVEGEWFGSFPTRASAETKTIQLAQASGELPTRVVVRENDGSERILWDPFQLVDNLWQNLRSKAYGSHTGPSDPQALRDEITRHVLECVERGLSDDDIIDFVLASFGVRRGLLAH